LRHADIAFCKFKTSLSSSAGFVGYFSWVIGPFQQSDYL
jgi:hypothetical protein